jgi:hypothetical protein
MELGGTFSEESLEFALVYTEELVDDFEVFGGFVHKYNTGRDQFITVRVGNSTG